MTDEVLVAEYDDGVQVVSVGDAGRSYYEVRQQDETLFSAGTIEEVAAFLLTQGEEI